MQDENFLRDSLGIPPYGPNGSQNRPQSTLFESNQSALYPEFFHDLGIEDVLLAQENKLVKYPHSVRAPIRHRNITFAPIRHIFGAISALRGLQ